MTSAFGFMGMLHWRLENHMNSCFVGWFIVTCNLSCTYDSHYHCPYCGTIIKSISQFENHLKKCDDESSIEERRSLRTSRSRRTSFQGGEGKSGKMEIDSAKSMTDEERKKHIERVKALTGENYVSLRALSNVSLLPLVIFIVTVNH